MNVDSDLTITTVVLVVAFLVTCSEKSNLLAIVLDVEFVM